MRIIAGEIDRERGENFHLVVSHVTSGMLYTGLMRFLCPGFFAVENRSGFAAFSELWLSFFALFIASIFVANRGALLLKGDRCAAPASTHLCAGREHETNSAATPQPTATGARLTSSCTPVAKIQGNSGGEMSVATTVWLCTLARLGHKMTGRAVE